MSAAPDLPYSGLRVLEFTHAIMGPAAGLVLADLGAEVIRIEPAPKGDHTRRLKGFGSGYYTFFNRNKKSVAIDLKTDVGREIAWKLIDSADVLIENFGPGTMTRLGFGYEAVSARNPRLIFCELKGFMPGPYEQRPALDEVVQMMSGLAYMTGPPGQPLRAGASVIDIMGGTFGALAVVVALQERASTGRGQKVQNGLFETAAYVVGQHMAYAAISQEVIPPMPARVSAWAIYRLFDTADGQQIFVGVTSDKHWATFCDAFDRRDLLADASLASNEQRIGARDRLQPELERMFAAQTLAEIVTRCAVAGIPFSPVAQPADLFDDPHLVAGDSLVSVQLPDGRRAPLPRLPLTLAGRRPGLRSDAPRLGEHTVAILRELNYSDADLRRWQAAAFIAAPAGAIAPTEPE